MAAEAAAKAVEARLRTEARSIREKYVSPPHSTDFGILFVPTEGLYAEALRRPGLLEALQREHKVMLAGPTTLLATLSSLQVGFRTLALREALGRGLGGAGCGEDRVRELRRRAREHEEEARRGVQQHRQAQTRANVMARRLRGVEGAAANRGSAAAAWRRGAAGR